MVLNWVDALGDRYEAFFPYTYISFRTAIELYFPNRRPVLSTMCFDLSLTSLFYSRIVRRNCFAWRILIKRQLGEGKLVSAVLYRIVIFRWSQILYLSIDPSADLYAVYFEFHFRIILPQVCLFVFSFLSVLDFVNFFAVVNSYFQLRQCIVATSTLSQIWSFAHVPIILLPIRSCSTAHLWHLNLKPSKQELSCPFDPPTTFALNKDCSRVHMSYNIPWSLRITSARNLSQISVEHHWLFNILVNHFAFWHVQRMVVLRATFMALYVGKRNGRKQNWF